MKPSKTRLTNRYNVLREAVRNNPYSTGKELRRIIVGDEGISRASKKELTYPEIMRRLNECCIKCSIEDKRPCSILKTKVFTWSSVETEQAAITSEAV